MHKRVSFHLFLLKLPLDDQNSPVIDGIELSTIEELCSNAQVEKLALTEIQKHATKCRLEKFEIPQAVHLISEMWIPETGLVTAAFKLKRKAIQDRYQSSIDRMYSK